MVARDLGLGSVSGWRCRLVLSIVVVVTRLLLQLHVIVSLCLATSRGDVGIIQLPTLTFAVTSFDQQLTLLRNARHCAKGGKQLVVARASEVTVRTRQRLGLLSRYFPFACDSMMLGLQSIET